MVEGEIVDILESFCKTIINCYDCSRLFLTDCKTTTMSLSLKADKVPYGGHAGTYIVPTVNEIAVVVVGDSCLRRDIRMQRRDANNSRQSSFLHRTAVSVDILGWRRWISFKY